MPDDIKLESLCLLSKIYLTQNQFAPSITLLQQAYDLSTQQPYWHCRVTFQIIVRKYDVIFNHVDLYCFFYRIFIILKKIIILLFIMLIVELSFVRELILFFVKYSFN